jgi:DNA-binding XRE family transcriptional regulator
MGESLGHLLSQARNALGLSQSDLASLLGVAKSAIYAWEHDKYKPATGKMVLILCYLQQVREHELAKELGSRYKELSKEDKSKKRRGQ